MELLSIGKFAKMVGVTPTTLRKMQESGELPPYHISKGGTRYYSMEQLKYFSSDKIGEKLVIGYCRVSAPSQKNDLETQKENLKMYMCAKGYRFEIIEDIGSGIDYSKKGLKTLLSKVNNQEIAKIVIMDKDRLVRFGYELIEYICGMNGVEIEIIDNASCSNEQEITDDLIQAITVFASQLYGQRSKKTKQLIDQVKNNAASEKNTAKTNP